MRVLLELFRQGLKFFGSRDVHVLQLIEIMSSVAVFCVLL